MAVLVRITDFIPNTLIQSQQVDDEFNQLVNILSGVSTSKNVLIKFSDATIPPLTLDQTGAGLIQSWKQNGVEVASVSNSGSLTTAGLIVSSAGPFLNLTDIDGEDFRFSVNGDLLDIINQTGPITYMTFRGGANDDIQMSRPIRATVGGSTPPILVVKEGTASATVPLVGGFPALTTLQTTNINNYWNLGYVNDAATSNWANYVTNAGELQFENYTTGSVLQGHLIFLPTGIISAFTTNGGAYYFTKTAGVTNGGSLIQTATSEFHLAFGTSNDPGTHTKALTWTDVGVGINKTSAPGAQLHVVSGVNTRIPFIADTPASPSVDLAKFKVNGSDRVQIKNDGSLKVSQTGAFTVQTHALELDVSGSNSGLLVVGGSGVNEIWKDTTPTFAASFGLAVPGVAITNDLIFSRFNGTTWARTLRVTNSESALLVNTDTVSAQTTILSGATSRVGLSVDLPSSPTVDIAKFKVNGTDKLQIKNNGQIVGVPKNVHTNSAATGNVTTGLDNLHSFSLPAASLAANGDYVRARYAGTFTTNDNDKRIVISFAGQTVHDPGLFDQDAGSWSYDIEYLRVSDTSIRFSVLAVWYFIAVDGAQALGGSNGFIIGVSGTITVADLDVNASTMLVQAEGTATDDIVQNFSIIELTQNT